jgi:zinc protease
MKTTQRKTGQTMMSSWWGLPVLLAGAMSVSAQQTVGQETAMPAKTPAVEPWKQIPIPKLHDFKPVEPKKIKLDNGLVIFLQEDHELPFVDGTILIRGGSRNEPADKAGLTSLYGEAWRTSGTSTQTGERLDDILALKAASIETGGGVATSSMTWSSFSKDFDDVFGLTLDLLERPAFKADKLALGKRELFTSISRRNDDAAGIAGREAALVAYGKNNPYDREVEYATVDAVKLGDLQSWHDRTVVPNNMIVAVEGDFDSATMEAKLRKAFGGMKPGVEVKAPEVAFHDPEHGVFFANKGDVDQSNVYIVGLGTERSNPDYYALSVMNEVFSGGFGSRVIQSVRTRLGLAYSVGGSYGAGYDHPGLFVAEAATKSASTVAATKAVLDEIARLKTVPPTVDELRSAKDQVLNSFIFNYDSPEKTLNEQVVLALYGYPPDFLDKYKNGIEKVTSADVARVANKYIDANKLAIVIVGNESEMGTPLKELGPVTNLDITIPPPPKGVAASE